jgi:alkaline phosphatase D
MKNLLTLTTILLPALLMAQVISGPMLGYNTKREVAIWLETATPQDVSLTYWATDDMSSKSTVEASTTANAGHTVTFKLALLEPGTTYNYQVEAGSKAVGPYSFTTQSLWHWREQPPSFSFLAGSCLYINELEYDRPGKPYGGDYEILQAMSAEDAKFMVWLGDNTYLREADYWSRSGIYHRYSHTRRTTEMQDLLRNMHHYAIWDDHDYGPNDSEWTYSLKEHTRDAFYDYWPTIAPIPDLGGITNHFAWDDCAFFMLDNRWYRQPKSDTATVLGKKQIDWLVDALRWSKASFKFVSMGGQFLSDAVLFENMAQFKEERQYILDAIDKYDIEDVVFLSGDRHHSELSRLETDDGQVIYDITSSPITSTAYDHSQEPNSYTWDDSHIKQRNYARIDISGPRKNRSLSVTFKDKDGKILKTHTLH